MKKDITIVDIANWAGVSKSTVSRVLTKDPKVKPQTRDDIIRVIEKSGYYPNEIARSLVKQKSNTIGLITPFQMKSFYYNEFFRDVFKGISNTLREQEYDVLMSSGKGVELDTIRKFVHTNRVAGIVLLYSIHDDPSLHYLVENSIPFSLIGCCDDFEEINLVTYDYGSAMREIMESLLGDGYKKIAFMVSDSGLSTAKAYMESYSAMLKKAGLPLAAAYMPTGLYGEAEVNAVMEGYRIAGNLPEAVIVSDESICGAFISYCQRQSIRIPEDIKIFSLEESRLNRLLGISSVSLDYIKMGEIAGELLVNTIEGIEHTHRVQLDYQIIQRDFQRKRQ
ncbi:MAG: LacI family DNA-binding transcriptional regulator [Hydrogenoanaerobacterium sp.]